MIRISVVLLLFVFAFSVAFVQRAQSQTSGSIVRVLATIEDVRFRGDVRTDFYFLWNRSVRARPLGHAFLSCTDIGREGALGSGVAICTGTYVMPLGKLAVSGVQHRRTRYTLIVTGGTGAYLGKNGSLHVRRIAPGAFNLRFRLS